MLNLKSELLKKQKEVSNLTSNKTSTIKGGPQNKKAPHWLKKNPGVDQRNQRDLVEVVEEDKHAKVEAILQAKSKLYDKMTSGDFIPDSEDTETFLVDFEQKSIDSWRERSTKTGQPTKPELNVKMSSEIKKSIEGAQEQWVEYVDSFGRTRTCLKEDLPRLEKQDDKLNPSDSKERTLMSADMRREDERVKWETSALEEMQNELHYENLRFGEIRELGVGYYSFSGKEEERKEQMKRLDQYRRETEKRKEENKTKKKKHQVALTARLEKVRQRRIKQLTDQGKEIPASLLEPIQLPPESNQEEEPAPSIGPSPNDTIVPLPPTSTKTREWDEGKDDWMPARPAPAPKSWIDPRNERKNEFAPPDFYYAGSKRNADESSVESPPPKQPSVEEHAPSSDNTDLDRIQRLISEVRNAPPAEQSTRETPVTSNVADDTDSAIPYTPSDKPISLKIISKPTKLLNTQSALDS